MAGSAVLPAVFTLPSAMSKERSQVHCLACTSAAVSKGRAGRTQIECRASAAAAMMSPTFPRTLRQSLEGAANNITVAPAKLSPPPIAEDGSVIQRIHSEEELHKVLKANPERLVVLMCKALGCRPCKAFTRRYQRMAESFPDCLFLDIYGDESSNTRQMMIKMKVRVTPTFQIFHRGQCIHSHGGISESSLREAIQEYHPALPL